MQANNYGCLTCVNSNCLIKKHIDNEAVREYLHRKNTFNCNQGQQFILEGAPVSGLYFIYQGAVKVYRQTPNKESQIIRFSKNGEIVGHRGFGTNYVYDISAAALKDTILCNFATDVLIEMLHKAPPLMFDFMLFYADQLQKSEANAKRFVQMSVRERVINGLLFIESKFGQTDGFINMTLSRRDIAEFAGTSTDQVIRVISALKKEGLLIAKGKKLGIPNIELFTEQLQETSYFLEG
ncbi:Crp/Fnr family transcriptional regulator [Mangrovibacterium diazotrophicum]|uniref:CRP-like cAMP-binding protein n=1 Tax=Mangrovibacterium diazotrophicum TaxID=1261403 RepID=A0A419VUE1_9BACT|nr:Crp/Fnr family transcriptional regulator [Mangrovibacterium diazotrophicum]RKD85066.1 CRP-like cAMP-binding protein [Mangrovibacterium diazotrophicum]